MRMPIPKLTGPVAGAIACLLGVLLVLLYVDETLHQAEDFATDPKSELLSEELETGKAVEQYNRRS